MLFLYNKEQKSITPCDETTFKVHSILERQDLEKWVEMYPQMLGEELLIITSEYDKFDKTNERIDLLALDKDGNLVVIELKRDDSGKYVDLQALKYAAYCSTLQLSDIVELYHQNKSNSDMSKEDCLNKILAFISNGDFQEINDKPRIILASKEFRSEVTASVLWLRKCGIDISCVKITPYMLDSNLVLDTATLIPLPESKEFMIQVEKKDINENKQPVLQMEYKQFYSTLVSKFREFMPRHYVQPNGKSYYQIPTGISGVHFEWAFHGRPRSSFGVELHFEKADKSSNVSMLEKIEPFQNALESEVSEKVNFIKDWGKTCSRLYVEKQEGKMTEELKTWACEKMIKLINLLQPEIDKFKN